MQTEGVATAPEPDTVPPGPARPAGATPRRAVCLVSPVSAKGNGGTAAYVRFLGAELSRDCAVAAVARFVDSPAGGPDDVGGGKAGTVLDCGPFQTRMVAAAGAWRPVLRRLPSLKSRRPLRAAAVGLFRMAFGGQVNAAAPAELDVVHYVGTGWEMLGFSALSLARRRGAIFAITPFVHPKLWGDGPMDLRLYRQADAVFVCSDLEADYLAGLGLERSRLRRTGLAPASEYQGDGQRFRRKHQLADRPLVLFIGRKQRYKGYHVLREAMADVVRAIPGACLVVVGPDADPPYPPLPDAAVLDIGSLDWSPAQQQEKADALAACDVFAMPSEGEAFGIVYVEAWSYAKPILGGPAPAVGELIEDGANGFFVKQDKQQVANALTRVLADPGLRARLGAAGYQRQQERFTWQAVARTHKAVYEGLLQQRPRP